MTQLTVEQIIAAKDLGEESVDMPEWGGTVLIRGLGYGEWVDLREAATVGERQDERLMARLLFAAALVDPPLTEEQAGMMVDKSSTAVTRLVEAIVNMSHVDESAITEAEATFREDA